MARITAQERRDRLGAVIQNELARAENMDSDSDTVRRAAIRYYNLAARGDEVEGRSGSQSADVRDMVTSDLAMLVPMLSTDSVVEFEPVSDEDRDQAAAETQAINKLVIDDNRGFIRFQEAIWDGLMMRNGAMKVWRDIQIDVRRYDVSELTEEQRTAAANEAEDNAPGTIAQLNGDTLKITRRNVRFRVGAVPIENLSWSSGSGELQDRRFFAEAMSLSRSSLIERGIPRRQVEDLGESQNTQRLNRRRLQDEDSQGETEDQELISCHECYILIDQDGDGISERWRVLVANENRVLEQERVQLIPYALGSPFLSPHQLTGESLSERLFPVQDSKTFMLRQLEDNIELGNNMRIVYDPAQVNEEDVLNPVAGGGIRARDPSRVVQLAVQDQSAGIIAGLTYQDKRRTEAGGASLDMMNADRQIVGETATGIERQYSQREMMVSMIAANLGETLIRDTYLITHAFMRAYAEEPFEVEMKGQFVPVDPRQWRPRTRVNVTVGATPSARAHEQMVINQQIGLQAQAILQGLNGVIASPQTLYVLSRRSLMLAGIRSTDGMLIDPSSPAAQQAAKSNQEQQQQQQQMQLQMLDRQLRIEELKVSNDARAKAEEIAWKYYDTQMDAATKEGELAGKAELELEKQRRENKSQERLAERQGARDLARDREGNRAASARDRENRRAS